MPQNLDKHQVTWQIFRVEFTLTKLQEEYSGQRELETITLTHKIKMKLETA